MYRELFYTEELENEAEELVFKVLKEIIDEKKYRFCKCNICIQDVAAIVLNSIKPMYSSNRFERITAPISEKSKKRVEEAAKEIRKEIIKATRIALIVAAVACDKSA